MWYVRNTVNVFVTVHWAGSAVW